MNQTAGETQESRKRTKPRPWKRRALLISAGVVLVAAAAFGAYRYYPKWTEDRMVRRARAYVAGNDYDSASIALQRVLQRNPGNVEAAALMAKMADSVKAPQALAWRKRVAELNPGDLDRQLDLAEKAMELNRPALAQATLIPLAE